MPALPIDDVLPDLLAAMAEHGRAVLQAPPGAGKTTRVPLALLEAGAPGRIVLLEPRRLAARAAAEHMAANLGQKVGESVGYRMRGATRVGPNTWIEVITEGILTRMLQADPDLPGIGTVIFDEFHERSLQADIGLALCLETAETLREDLRLLVMSATLDAEPVADLMGAPVLTSQGQSFAVDLRWLSAPLKPVDRRADALADLILQAEAETRAAGGAVLAFLPGEPEIRRVAGNLARRLPRDCEIRPLFGALPFADQQAALAPMTQGRKVVLATSIAETSLTIPDVRVVVDGGQARRSRFDPGSGMSRLVTEKVTRAEARQRAGRAGRVAEGTCYKLWTKGEDGALAAFPPPEIASTDLAGLALDCALWGTRAEDLAFLTAPPAPALAEARALLTYLGALAGDGRITDHGRALAALPVHPRLAHMLVRAGPSSALLAALLEDRDPLRGAPADLTLRLQALRAEPGAMQVARPARDRIRAEARRLARRAGREAGLTAAEQAALAYPDRIGQHRSGGAARFVLSGGKGARLADDDPLAASPYLVVLDTDGDPREARIRMAAAITAPQIRSLFEDRIDTVETCEWSRRERRVIARRQDRLGAITLRDAAWSDVPKETIARAMADGARDLGLVLDGDALRLARRVELVRANGADLPDFSVPGLMATLDDWLLPYLDGVRTAEDWRRFDPLPALQAALGWDGKQIIDKRAPAHFVTPLGRKVAINYGEEDPEIELRLQEMFGVTRHPVSAGRPLKITLLSPAGRPVQVTRDLPGFWAGSYGDVRKEMRARYPRHPWPEDPTTADPTLRAKPRK
ncbi:MAG: ATP-dependent helicase HrpB [Marinibacterium sp.]